MITEVSSFSDLGLVVGDEVFAENDQLYIGTKLSISIKELTVWQSSLSIFPIEVKTLRDNLAAARAFINSYGKAGGMKQFAGSSSFERETMRLLEERSSGLLNALANDSMEEATHYAIRLMGLGSGLTPSGDDFLVGLFAAIHLPQSPISKYQPWCREVVNDAAELTNEISYMALKKAAWGQVRESMGQMLHSLMYESKENMLLGLSAVLDIGSSSGTDIALGIISGLNLNLEQRWR
ncbi:MULTISPECIES: DUF2877 domain-containing protein [unclassified Paenibacillus]|uniref:DUF2877 domain-containing protein n=1 Tax=unclassified Paenibacillus TaxID=185978 RepID=UPI0030D1462F